jgi:hypothetical protein
MREMDKAFCMESTEISSGECKTTCKSGPKNAEKISKKSVFCRISSGSYLSQPVTLALECSSLVHALFTKKSERKIPFLQFFLIVV